MCICVYIYIYIYIICTRAPDRAPRPRAVVISCYNIG